LRTRIIDPAKPSVKPADARFRPRTAVRAVALGSCCMRLPLFAIISAMPFSMCMEAGVVIGTCSGVLGLDDAKAGASAVWENPDWRGKPLVWDFRSAELEFAAPQVRELAQFILDSQPSPPPPKVAFVTGRDVDFGMVRMFEVFRAGPSTEVRAFRDYDEALSWAR
jgi:hypothetical protein